MGIKLRIAEIEEYFKGPVFLTTDAEGKLPESKVESRSTDVAKVNGWWSRKFKTPTNRGAPDRIFVKEGRVVFIEYKRVGKVPTPLQRQVAAEMLDHDAEVWWTDSVRGTKSILGINT